MSKHKKNKTNKQLKPVTREKPCDRILELERENLALYENNAILSMKVSALKDLSKKAIKKVEHVCELLNIASSRDNAYRRENRLLWVAFILLSITNIMITIFGG